ncbi:6277_t:CDS:2 [Entrophospora sp. SA101]|nr:6277_t:CDS:2 [Entrophospora sp. SA101]
MCKRSNNYHNYLQTFRYYLTLNENQEQVIEEIVNNYYESENEKHWEHQSEKNAIIV